MREWGVERLVGLLLMCALGFGLSAVAWYVNSHQEWVSSAARPARARAPSDVTQAPPLAQSPTQRQKFQQLLAQAEPLLNQLRSGMVVSEEDILEADVGLLEPLLLAQAAHNREIVALAVAYEAATSGLAPEQLLVPLALASPRHRTLIRAALQQRALAATTFTTQLHSATTSGRLRLQSALMQMPGHPFTSAIKEFDDAMAPLTAYVDGLDAATRETDQAITALLDLLDRDPQCRVVDTGRSFELKFKNAAASAEYQRHRAAAARALQREQENEARFAAAPLLTRVSLTN